MSNILVTGASGFVGSHCIVQLLRLGHSMRGTVRNLARAGDVHAMIRSGGADPAALELVEADLMQDAGWSTAAADQDYVLHVASPFPSQQPDDENALIVPARDGALRVLRAARDAGVKRVVLTSSFAAIGYGHGRVDRIFDEGDWTNVAGSDVQPYIKSKAVAERAAWDFMAAEGGALELSVINPVGIFGPILGTDISASVDLVRQLLTGAMPATPRIHFGVVDVRDVADLHIRAMTNPDAVGERFIAVSGKTLSLHDAAMLLRDRLGAAADRVPTGEMPDAVVRQLAEMSPGMADMVPVLGLIREATSAKAERVLGWRPRPAAEAIVASAETLIEHGLGT